MVAVVFILLAVGVFLYAWLAQRKEGVSDPLAVVTAVETFATQMETENDRLVEMIAGLRQKMDSYEVQKEREMYALKNEIHDLQEQVTMLHEQRPLLESSSEDTEQDMLPEFLSPKYKDVAQRIARGDDAQTIMMELNVGFGEVDLVQGLLRNGRVLS